MIDESRLIILGVIAMCALPFVIWGEIINYQMRKERREYEKANDTR